MERRLLYVEAIKNAVKEKGHCCAEEALNMSVDYFYRDLVTKNDQALIDIAFNPHLTQEELNTFLSSYDIECAGSYKALLLSYVMHKRPDLKWDAYTGPRVKGVLNFFRFRNLELMAHYTKIGKALNVSGIKPMIFKGGAMKYLRPELSRTMGDIDILLQTKEEYEKAKEIVRKLGYDFVDNDHSVDLFVPGKEEGVVDIHQFLEMRVSYDYQKLNKVFFKRAVIKAVFGVETYLPCFEDLVFISLSNMVKNIRESTSVHSILYAVLDVEWLCQSKNDFDWNIVKEDIAITGTEPSMATAIGFANKIIPNLVPSELINDEAFKRHVVNWYNRDLFNALYVFDVKMECKKLRLKNAFKSWADFKHYFRIEGQHFFTKRIAKSQTLINLFLKIMH